MASQSKAQLLNTIAALRAELDSATLTQEKKAEELYISEERFALAMRGANDGLWDWNLRTNEVYYSPRWKAMLGYSEDEFDNTLDAALSLLHPEDKQHTTKSIENCLSNKTSSFEAEMRMRHKNGGVLLYSLSCF